MKFRNKNLSNCLIGKISWAYIAIGFCNFSSAKEKGIDSLTAKKPLEIYKSQDVRGELISMDVYPLDVVANLRGIARGIRITFTGEWKESKSYLIYQADSGFGLRKSQKNMVPFGLLISSCEISEQEFRAFEKEFDDTRKGVLENNEEFDLEKGPFPWAGNMLVIEKLSSADEFFGLILGKNNSNNLLESAQKLADVLDGRLEKKGPLK